MDIIDQPFGVSTNDSEMRHCRQIDTFCAKIEAVIKKTLLGFGKLCDV